MLLAALDEVDFGAFEHAYGAADDVPAHLRAVEAGGEGAAKALHALYASLWHQGTYYPATPVVMPFLVDLATSPSVADRHEILSLIGLFARVRSPGAEGFDPFVWTSQPAPPEYPDAKRTLEVLALARPRFEALVWDEDPRVRIAAARIVGAIAPEDESRVLGALLARETSNEVRAALVLLLGGGATKTKLGEDVPTSELERACRTIVRASDGPLDEDDARLMAWALASRPLDPALFPLSGGDLASIASGAVARLADREPARAATMLHDALYARLARGERPDLHEMTSGPTFDEPPEPFEPDAEQRSFAEDAALRALLAPLVQIIFQPVLARQPTEPLLREELTDAQRELCVLTRDYGLPLPVRCLPWLTKETMKRFLRAGPLDRRVRVRDRDRPIWVWFHEASAALDDGSPELLEEVIASLESLDACATFDLARDVLDGSYPIDGCGGECLGRSALERFLAWVSPRVDSTEGAFHAYAEELLVRAGDSRGSQPEPSQVAFAFGPLLAAAVANDSPVDARFDPLLPTMLHDVDPPAWFLALPIERRSALVGRLAADGFDLAVKNHRDHVDLALVTRAVLEAVAQPGYRDARYNLAQTLVSFGGAAGAELERVLAIFTGRRRVFLERVIGEISGAWIYQLQVKRDGDAHVAEIRSKTGVLATERWEGRITRDMVKRFAARLPDPRRVILEILTPTNALAYLISNALDDADFAERRSGGPFITGGGEADDEDEDEDQDEDDA